MKKAMLFLLPLALFFGPFLRNAEAQIAVIVNKKNSTNDLSLEDLKHIYLGKVSTFSNKQAVILTEFAPLKKRFYKIVTNKSVDKIKKYWISYVLSGKTAAPPTEYKYLKEVKEFVLKNPGAICFIDAKDVDKSVKVLTIDGKKFSSAKYPLK